MSVLFNKPENEPPVCPNGHRPKPLKIALERVKPQAGKIQIGQRTGNVEPGQQILKLDDMFSQNASRVILLEQALQPFMAKLADHGSA
jgi:hypothetical protein